MSRVENISQYATWKLLTNIFLLTLSYAQSFKLVVDKIWPTSGSRHVSRRFRSAAKIQPSNTLVGSYTTPRGERVSGPPPRHLAILRREPWVPSNLWHPQLSDISDSRWTQISNRRSGFPAQLHCYSIPHVLNTFPFLVRTVMDGGGYPGMSIPTKKCNNLTDMEGS